MSAPFVPPLLPCPAAVQPIEVSIEARIGSCNQPAIVRPFASTALVAGCEQERSPPRIEREGKAPHAAAVIEAQRLHVGVLAAVERMDAWPDGRCAGPLCDPCLR